MSSPAYSESAIVAKLKERLSQNLPLKIVFSDLDSTLVSYPPTPLTDKAREAFEAHRYSVVFVTSKAEEMIISEKERTLKPDFPRPVAHMKLGSEGKHSYQAPEETEPAGVLDADIVAGSSGTTILVKQLKGGYLPDKTYHIDIPLTPDIWRKEILQIINDLNSPNVYAELAAIEFKENYQNGVSNVYPPDYRVELHFSALQNKTRFVSEFLQAASGKSLQVQITDDSFPALSNYSIYISPQGLSKNQAVDHILASLAQELNVQQDSIEVLICGDSFPDLKMGLFSAAQSPSTFLLVANSPLAKALFDESSSFASEDLKEIKQNLKPAPSKKGFYTYLSSQKTPKTVVIGNQAFPNTSGPETILAFLEQA